MLKDDDPTKESSEEKARRKWRNNALSKSYREHDQKRIRLIDKKPELSPEIAEVIENAGRRDGSMTRFEKKFLRELREMLRGETDRNLKFYAAHLAHQKNLSLREKLRRLQAKQAAQPAPKPDLF